LNEGLRVVSRLTAIVFLVLAACKGPPARLVAGSADSVVLNNVRPVQLSMQVFDAAGHALPNTAVRFQWASGINVPISRSGVVTCTHAGDMTLRASLGPLVRSLLVRCRPVRRVFGGGSVNLVLGDPPYDLLFEGVDSAGRPVRPLSAVATVDDSMIVALGGWRIRARNPGTTGVDVYVGDEWVHWYVQVFEPALTLDSIRPGQHLAVPVRLSAGELHRWQLPAWSSHEHSAGRGDYEMQMLPTDDTLRTPRLAVVGAICDHNRSWSYECLAPHGASVIAYHPPKSNRAGEWSGTLAVVRRP
jgi:hypothetical protein